MTVIDWHAEVKEYKEQYDDDDGIHEWIHGLVPIYYGKIYTTFHDVIGSPLTIEIEPHHIGRNVGDIMLCLIFDEYIEQFMQAWNEAEAEEEE